MRPSPEDFSRGCADLDSTSAHNFDNLRQRLLWVAWFANVNFDSFAYPRLCVLPAQNYLAGDVVLAIDDEVFHALDAVVI